MKNKFCKTLLHPNIAKLYQIEANIDANHFKKLEYIKADGTYNWKNIEELLLHDGKISKQEQIYPKTYSEYLHYVQLLQSVIRLSESTLPTITNDNSWFSKLTWLGQNSRLKFILQKHLHPTSATSTVENILFLTSTLENALANVYQTIANKSPPHLLKDLLDTKELKEVLGAFPIFFLKILMGSPESINLRNITWHGFLLPHEVPPHFVATLLILSASLSSFVETLTITPRPQVNDFSRFLSKIKTTPTDFKILENTPQVIETIENSQWTGEWKVYWIQLLQHYDQHNYWQFVILILPQIELVLRKMYGEANDFDFTAKLKEYYITMNSIFEHSDDNRLLKSFLSRETLHFLYDIFISPFGMRVRDKVSHGEVQLGCVDRELCSVLLYAGLNLLNGHKFPLENYQSRFHLNSLAYEAMVASKRCVLQFMTLQPPNGFPIELKWDQEVLISLRELVIAQPIEIFERPKREPEVMTILMKIAQLVVQICENYQISFEERFRLFLSRELRSRARKTLERMVENVSHIAETLASIVVCLVRFKSVEFSEDNFVDFQRFYKETLKIVENLLRYSDKESNEWLNAVECCNRFNEVKSRWKLT